MMVLENEVQKKKNEDTWLLPTKVYFEVLDKNSGSLYFWSGVVGGQKMNVLLMGLEMAEQKGRTNTTCKGSTK